ncbi:PIN domain nuclease [Rhabdobacter roseus]|uniref:Putative nucleic acid-binding protein n=1 Tax=Rhabdobacter roseus TaxID=1655419 RepID=A0A840TPX8_9BACT|nr:PIN domain-containing protein [Rhabdobacter roseus]MBB5285394.1 putative nucleic acid-binding protein [Rhabdobacter roseus]
MDKLLVDTNIVIDLLAKREYFYQEAQELFTLADTNQAELHLSALTVADTHYLLASHYKLNETRKILLKFKVLVTVLPIDDTILELALTSDFKDFEDAVQYYVALKNNVEMIITRNKKDFKNSSLPVLTAREYLNSK